MRFLSRASGTTGRGRAGRSWPHLDACRRSKLERPVRSNSSSASMRSRRAELVQATWMQSTSRSLEGSRSASKAAAKANALRQPRRLPFDSTVEPNEDAPAGGHASAQLGQPRLSTDRAFAIATELARQRYSAAHRATESVSDRASPSEQLQHRAADIGRGESLRLGLLRRASDARPHSQRTQMPGCRSSCSSRPLVRRCFRDIDEFPKRSRRTAGSKIIWRARPVSTTAVTPSTVTDVSATFVAKTTFAGELFGSSADLWLFGSRIAVQRQHDQIIQFTTSPIPLSV